MPQRDATAICITCDVDWAPPEAIADFLEPLDASGLRATLFCTHAGIEAPGHERALHPNFRRNGDTMRKIRADCGNGFESLDEVQIYADVVSATLAFAPEAVGVRSHSLFYDSLLIEIFQKAGLQYDSSYLLPLASGLTPVWKEYDILELPIYFNDHFELKADAVGLDAARIALDTPGLKVIQLHPQLVYTNAPSNAHYLQTRPFTRDATRLLKNRHQGRGVRTFYLDLIERILASGIPVMTLGEVNRQWRTKPKWPGPLSTSRTDAA